MNGASFVCALSLLLAIPANAQDWTRNFRIGMSAGINLRAQFDTGAGDFPLGGGQPGEYSDGYVRTDVTGNAGGQTWNWGYNSSDQYDPNSRMLSFESPQSYSTTGGASEAEDEPYLGFDMAYAGYITHWKKIRLGWEFGFQYLPVDIQDNRSFMANITSTTFQYQVPDGVTLPDATPGNPYQGTFDGPGALISTDPIDGGTTTGPGLVSGSRELDVTLYNLRLGPTLYWDLHRYVAVSVSGGFAMSIISGDYSYQESLSSGGFGTTDLVYGGYAGGVVYIHVQHDADIYLGAHFMTLGDFSLRQGGRGVSLDLSQGILFSAGISWPF